MRRYAGCLLFLCLNLTQAFITQPGQAAQQRVAAISPCQAPRKLSADAKRADAGRGTTRLAGVQSAALVELDRYYLMHTALTPSCHAHVHLLPC